MYSRNRTPVHTSYQGVEVQTVPGLSYSIAELLSRVIRNQPIPMLNVHDDSGLEDPVDPVHQKHVLSDKDVDEHIEKELSNPMNNPDLDLVMAAETIQDIDQKANQ